jgi:hypothetical protein
VLSIVIAASSAQLVYLPSCVERVSRTGLTMTSTTRSNTSIVISGHRGARV